ncbi:Carbon starvation induced regulator [Ruegeria denitrificans]|uniref:Carbon starvation induced regulator n=1 Tax=Ruegeria denitrificans TaxID=1715692 RepID=A0A0P1IST1_9RHOB|nr:FCD domain-containing protein [Ruegeria denitrificans]CUK19073.1 Carbon starvation induced regulator [Ruegeria denitrificans]
MTQNKLSTAEQVYADLRALILNGTLRAAQNLRATALKNEYGFGLTPLREALNRLNTEHLVVSNFNQGFRVADISLSELEDLGRTRILLETAMLTEAMERGDDAWESAIVAAHYQLGKLDPPSYDADDAAMTLWEQRHEAFHEALFSTCQSPWLRRLANTIDAQRKRYHRNILLGVGEMAQSDLCNVVNARLAQIMGLQPHTELMEAVLARDIERACTLQTKHVALTSEAYLSIKKLLNEQRAA